jgi:hypothetical protein
MPSRERPKPPAGGIKANFPGFLAPALATSITKVPSGVALRPSVINHFPESGKRGYEVEHWNGKWPDDHRHVYPMPPTTPSLIGQVANNRCRRQERNNKKRIHPSVQEMAKNKRRSDERYKSQK